MKIVEEDEQTSSWESEPEGENAEELASLETHDEVGEWCWPKKGRVTRWRRRIDSRPAVDNLAEEDEDEQVSRGLNHLASRSAAGTQWTWKKVTVEVRLRSSRECDAEEHVSPRCASDKQRGPRMEKGSRGPGEREHQELWAASHVRQDP